MGLPSGCEEFCPVDQVASNATACRVGLGNDCCASNSTIGQNCSDPFRRTGVTKLLALGESLHWNPAHST
jgi:hypothetical protein